MKTAIEQLRTNLVQNVYATVLTAGSPTAPATQASPAAPIATTNTITIEADTTALEERFNKALAELEAKLTAGSANDKATATAELSEFKKDFATSISGLRDSQALLEDQVKAQAALLAAAQAKIDGLQAGQGDLAKAVDAAKAEAADVNKATASRLDTAMPPLTPPRAKMSPAYNLNWTARKPTPLRSNYRLSALPSHNWNKKPPSRPRLSYPPPTVPP